MPLMIALYDKYDTISIGGGHSVTCNNNAFKVMCLGQNLS